MPTGLTSTIVTNNALQFIGAQTQITSLNDGSTAALAASVLYQPCVQLMLRVVEPDFARIKAVLTLAGSFSPPPPWTYEYQYPSDCLRLLQVSPPAGYNVNDPQPIRSNVGFDVRAAGFFDFGSTNPGPGDTITLGGTVVEWVGSSPIHNELLIQGSLTISLNDAVDNATSASLNQTSQPGYMQNDPNIGQCIYTYSGSGGQLNVLYKLPGIGGMSFTLAASAAAPSGAALTLGAPQKVILTNQVNGLASYISSTVTEVQWDGAFEDAVIRRLANPLAMALSGRPDFAKELLEEASRVASICDGVDDSSVGA